MKEWLHSLMRLVQGRPEPINPEAIATVIRACYQEVGRQHGYHRRILEILSVQPVDQDAIKNICSQAIGEDPLSKKIRTLLGD